MKNNGSGKAKTFLKSHGALIGVVVVLMIALTVFAPNFGKVDNFVMIIRQTSMNLLIALGMTMVIISGCIDLSVGGIYATVGILTARLLLETSMPLVMAIALGLLAGALFGLFNGLLTAYTKIPPFIATLGTSYIAGGAAYIMGGGTSRSVIVPAFNQLGLGMAGKIPVPVFYIVVLGIVVSIILNRTRLGRGIYAVGSNVTAAQFSGIQIRKIKLFVYIASGMLAAFSGIVGTARVFVAQPDAGTGYEIDAIAAVVIGGTSFEGGKGTVFGTIIGCLLITVMGNGMNLLGISTYWQKVVKGVIILVAVFVDEMITARNGKKVLNSSKA